MKRLSLILAIFICCGISGCTYKGDSKVIENTSEAIEKANNIEVNIKADVSTIEENLKIIASNIRDYGLEGEKEASEYIKYKLEEYGYKVQFEEFDVYEQTLRSTMSAKTNEEYFNNNPYNSEKLGEGRNVVAKQSNEL